MKPPAHEVDNLADDEIVGLAGRWFEDGVVRERGGTHGGWQGEERHVRERRVVVAHAQLDLMHGGRGEDVKYALRAGDEGGVGGVGGASRRSTRIQSEACLAYQ